METLTINIINPKALKLLNDLADMDLISIEDNRTNEFEELLNKWRNKDVTPLSLEEITKEVEAVRAERYTK